MMLAFQGDGGGRHGDGPAEGDAQGARRHCARDVPLLLQPALPI